MDLFEKKLHELYQQKKREDEKSMPGFDAFRDKLEQKDTTGHSWFFLKVAALVVLVVAAGLLYRYGPVKQTAKVYPAKINQNLPTQSLLDKSAGGEYIWNWKAPSDQLLKDATKSIKTKR